MPVPEILSKGFSLAGQRRITPGRARRAGTGVRNADLYIHTYMCTANLVLIKWKGEEGGSIARRARIENPTSTRRGFPTTMTGLQSYLARFGRFELRVYIPNKWFNQGSQGMNTQVQADRQEQLRNGGGSGSTDFTDTQFLLPSAKEKKNPLSICWYVLHTTLELLRFESSGRSLGMIDDQHFPPPPRTVLPISPISGETPESCHANSCPRKIDSLDSSSSNRKRAFFLSVGS